MYTNQENSNWNNAIRSVDLMSTNGNPACTQDLPPGSYKAEIIDATHQVVGDGDREYDQVTVNFKLLDKLPGQLESKNYHLTSKKSADFIKKEFSKMGVELSNKDQLDSACKQITGKKVKTNVQYANGNKVIYITGSCDDEDSKSAVDRDAIW